MPLGHIWWTKKIFGKLLKHFAQNRHETGVCVGFNPFKDVDVLAKKLLLEETLGDADFGTTHYQNKTNDNKKHNTTITT